MILIPSDCKTQKRPVGGCPDGWVLLCLYYYLIESFKSENEKDLIQDEDNDDGGLTPAKEADEVMCKSFRLQLNISIK